ncbi:Hypothetical protein AKI40_1613 [Enterobacter sp. FY-07]|nr:Hypothetical protein AKI40_1613 [Enterobacter sp. FY-07]
MNFQTLFSVNAWIVIETGSSVSAAVKMYKGVKTVQLFTVTSQKDRTK